MLSFWDSNYMCILCRSQTIHSDTISYKCLRHSSGLALLMGAPHTFPPAAKAVAGPAFGLLIMIVWCTQQSASGNFENNKVYYSQVLEDTHHAQGHTVRPWKSGEGGDRERNWGSAFIGVEGEVPRVLRVQCLFVSLKLKRINTRKGKSSTTQVVSYLGQKELPKGGNIWKGGLACLFI